MFALMEPIGIIPITRGDPRRRPAAASRRPGISGRSVPSRCDSAGRTAPPRRVVLWS